ncbi:MAG: NADH:flavin oxidoreductase [Deltaproteobacteria bacterium]|nr:NADH:flavin oxidoreductase [Deltaproteobacteria bacterium]
MTKKPSRRDFLKSGLAASAILMVGTKATRAGQRPDLFERTRIKSLELPNRFIKSSTWCGTGDGKGRVTDRTLAMYSELAKGGVGLILTGGQYVMTNGVGLPYAVGNCDDSQAEGLKGLADTVHKEGCKIVAQLSHQLARANSKLFSEGDEVWGASAVPYSPSSPVPKEMTQSDIARYVDAFAAAAGRSYRCGFDGVMIHAAHSFGVHQFLSGAWNQRQDSYGGSPQNRYRVVREILEAIRGKVGPDFPIMIKLSAHDFVKGGLEPTESLEIARRLEQDGIAAIQVSACCTVSNKDQHCPKDQILDLQDEAYLMDFTLLIKEGVKVPVIAVGGIRSFSTAEGIVKQGKADYVSLGRPFIREPNLINRWKSGDTAKAKCVSCNGCFETGMQGLGISCKIERMLKENKQES